MAHGFREFSLGLAGSKDEMAGQKALVEENLQGTQAGSREAGAPGETRPPKALASRQAPVITSPLATPLTTPLTSPLATPC